LTENPLALSQFVRLCAASPWITSLLAESPVLLDELMDARNLYHPPDRQVLEHELTGRMSGLDVDDIEAQMEAMSYFKQSNVLRVAAADVTGNLPVMKVSDHLTDIAEVILEATQLVWQHLVKRHGRPRCEEAGEVCDTGFAVIAYGKLGGIELGYGSDLDLVFVYSGEAEALTRGRQRVENAVFFARLGQRLIHMLSTLTSAGVLYEVDTRLRPDGASGLMVTFMAALSDYQRNSAWTWEHQALVRARPVAGDPHLFSRFNALRHEILSQPRDIDTLRNNVLEMRERMRSEKASKQAGEFDIKHDRGGITDIEFMVQYGVLRWAAEHPALTRWTDDIRLLESLAEAGLMSADDAELLAEAYRAYRVEVHHLTLRGLAARVPEDRFADYRSEVTRLWNQWLQTGD